MLEKSKTSQEAPKENKAQVLPFPDNEPTSSVQQQQSQQLERTDSLDEDSGKIVFDVIELDEASEKVIRPLRDDEEVVLLMPAKEFVIRHGPKRTVLYWLCSDLAKTEKINGFLESELPGVFFHHHRPDSRAYYCRNTHPDFAQAGVKVLCAYLALLVLVSMLAMTETFEAVPYELTWLAILTMPDALRKFFKLNAEAVALVLREIDFWVPFVTMCLGTFFASASFGHEGAAITFSIAFVISATVNILLGKRA